MNKDLKKLINPVVKIEGFTGIVLLTISFLFQSSDILISFATGILITAINFLLNGYITDFGIRKEKSFFIIAGMYIRILAVVLTSLMFTNKLSTLVAYIIGFLSHFIIVMIIWFTKLKGSE